MNRLSTQNISCTINSLHHYQQALTTLSSLKQFVPQQFIKQNECKGSKRICASLQSIRQMNRPPTRSNSRSNNPLLITEGTNALSSQINTKQPRTIDSQIMGWLINEAEHHEHKSRNHSEPERSLNMIKPIF